MGEGALPRGGVKGSQGGHGGRRGGPQKAEDPHLDGTGEKNPWHCGKGLGLRRSRAICHTRVPESTPSWTLGSFSGPGQNPRAPDHTHHAQGVPWLQDPPNRGLGVGVGWFREGRPWPNQVPQWVPSPHLCSQRPFSLGAGTSPPPLPVPSSSPLSGSFLRAPSPNPISIHPLTQKPISAPLPSNYVIQSLVSGGGTPQCLLPSPKLS